MVTEETKKNVSIYLRRYTVIVDYIRRYPKIIFIFSSLGEMTENMARCNTNTCVLDGYTLNNQNMIKRWAEDLQDIRNHPISWYFLIDKYFIWKLCNLVTFNFLISFKI